MQFENDGIKKTTLVDQQGRTLEIIEVDNSHCFAQIALQGAQVLRFQSKKAPLKQTDLLWCSDQAVFLPNKPVRGGIPLCFPWFGSHQNPDLPAHGFARQLPWQLTHVEMIDDEHLLRFELSDDAFTHQFWDHDFHLVLDVHCAEELTLNLIVHNTDQVAWSFGFAWHSYFSVKDISTTQILGLENTPFINKLDVATEQQTHTDAIVIDQELDRVYQYASGHYTIVDEGNESILIRSPKCESAVVWNPWQDKAAGLGDVGDGWQRFVCVECGQFGEVDMLLAAGQSYRFDMTLALSCPPK